MMHLCGKPRAIELFAAKQAGFSVRLLALAGLRGDIMKWRTLLFVVLFALMASGGSFTCFWSSGDHHDHDHDHHDPPPSTQGL
jgi:hypothetical protein